MAASYEVDSSCASDIQKVSDEIKWPQHVARYLWMNKVIDNGCFGRIASALSPADKSSLLKAGLRESHMTKEEAMDAYRNALMCTAQGGHSVDFSQQGAGMPLPFEYFS